MRKTLLLFSAFFVSHLAQAVPITLEFDPIRSSLIAVTRRAGLFGFLGHEHAIEASRWSANVEFDLANLSASHADFEIQVAALVADSLEARRSTGLSLPGPSDSDRAKIQAQMLGPEVLDREKYPMIKFHSVEAKQSDRDTLILKGALGIHGKNNVVEFPVKYSLSPSNVYRFRGKITFKMSEFGINPPSTAGVVGVKDEMEIQFDLVSSVQRAISSR